MALSKIRSDSIEDTAIHGHRNLVINGAMQVAQRGTSASAKSSAGYHVVDRFRFVNNTSTGAVDIEQSTTVPAGQGFGSSLKVSTSTAKATLTGTNEFGIQHRMEGQDLQSLNYGTSSASKATLSFWVRSNKTGTYVVWLYQTGNNRNIQKQFTISSADTWEKKELTIDGDTSGSLANDNSNELEFFIVLGTGPDRSSGTAPTAWETLDNADRYVGQTVNILDSTSNTFYLTGVQLEVGEKATPFEHRSYADELQRCQRYFYRLIPNNGGTVLPLHNEDDGGENIFIFGQLPEMRAGPTITNNFASSYNVDATLGWCFREWFVANRGNTSLSIAGEVHGRHWSFKLGNPDGYATVFFTTNTGGAVYANFDAEL